MSYRRQIFFPIQINGLATYFHDTELESVSRTARPEAERSPFRIVERQTTHLRCGCSGLLRIISRRLRHRAALDMTGFAFTGPRAIRQSSHVERAQIDRLVDAVGAAIKRCA